MLVKDEFVMKMMQLVHLLGKEVIATLFSQCPCRPIKAEKECSIAKHIQYGILGGEQSNSSAEVSL